MLKSKDLISLLKEAVIAGAEKALVSAGVLVDQISKAEAYRLYGRTDVDRWISENLISLTHRDQQNSKKYLDRKLLEAIASGSNRISYLPVADRHSH